MPVAQLVEHSPFKGAVMSSSLIRRTKLCLDWKMEKKPPIKLLALKLRSYLFTGILITAPVVITFWIVVTLVKVFDKIAFGSPFLSRATISGAL